MALLPRVRTFLRRRRVRHVLVVVATVVTLFEWSALAFHWSCGGRDPEGLPHDRASQVAAWAAAYPDYLRPQESTYLTWPEWYEVFSYQEYGAFIEDRRPSRFPYFAAVGQFWGFYCEAYGRTESDYPFNAGVHLMIGVIGVSFTVEYAAKGLYENTWGTLTQLNGFDTAEDAFAAQTAQDFGQFVETRPWYEYPFASKAVGIWTDVDGTGAHPIRKYERKVFLTLEYGVKAVYGGLIHLATKAVYGAPPARDYLWVDGMTEAAWAVPGVERVEDLPDGSHVIVLPHYQGFTNAVPALARLGVDFRDVAGNDHITLTVLAPREWAYDLPQGEVIYDRGVLTDKAERRFVVRSPVTNLDEVIRGLDASGARIEHLFDY